MKSNYQRTIDKFNYQYSRDKKYITIIEKKLFIYAQRLKLADWRIIRGGDFWEQYNQLTTDFDRKKFTLDNVEKYLNKNQ